MMFKLRYSRKASILEWDSDSFTDCLPCEADAIEEEIIELVQKLRLAQNGGQGWNPCLWRRPTEKLGVFVRVNCLQRWMGSLISRMQALNGMDTNTKDPIQV